MMLIFIHGPAAAGKHTIGQLLSEKLSIPLFHNHLVVDVAKSLFDFGDPSFIRIREAMWRLCFEEASKAGKSFIFTFNPERTVDPKLIQDLVDMYANAGGEVIYVELLCSDEEVLRRIDNESRKQFGKLTDGRLYKQFKAGGGFDFPEFPEPLIKIDTEMSFPIESVNRIVKALEASEQK